MPLAVLGTMRLLRGEARGAWLTGASLAAQFLCCIYYGVFMITVWPLVAGVEWLRTRPPLPRPAGRAAARVAARRRGRRRRLRAAVPARPGRRRRSRGLRDRALQRHARELRCRSRRRTGCWAGRRRPTTPSAGSRPGWWPRRWRCRRCSRPTAPWTLALTVGRAGVGRRVARQPRLDLPVLRRSCPPYRGLRVPARFAADRAAVRGAAGGDRLRQPGAAPRPHAASPGPRPWGCCW